MITLSDNTGKSFEDKILIKDAGNTEEGVAAEYDYLTDRFGVRNVDWVFIRQSLTPERDKYFDKILIEVNKDKKIEIYFEITEFFGKGKLFGG